jgi:hypothetical protein
MRALYPNPASDRLHLEVNVSRLQPGSYHYALEIGGRSVAHHNLMVQ